MAFTLEQARGTLSLGIAHEVANAFGDMLIPYRIGNQSAKMSAEELASRLNFILSAIPQIELISATTSSEACQSNSPPIGNFGLKVALSEVGMITVSQEKLSKEVDVQLTNRLRAVSGNPNSQTVVGDFYRRVFVLNGDNDTGFDPSTSPTGNAIYICIDGD